MSLRCLKHNIFKIGHFIFLSVIANLQDGPHDPHLLHSPSHTVSGLICMTTEFCRNDSVWLPRLSHKRHCGLCLALSSDHSLWRKPAALLWGPSSNPMERPMWWGAGASCHVSELSGKLILQPQLILNLRMTATAADILIAISLRHGARSTSEAAPILLFHRNGQGFRAHTCVSP